MPSLLTLNSEPLFGEGPRYEMFNFQTNGWTHPFCLPMSESLPSLGSLECLITGAGSLLSATSPPSFAYVCMTMICLKFSGS